MIEALLQAERSLTVGQLDAAERVYRQTIQADPRNSIAVVGLARVALERGDDAGAHGFARRALEIDPQNAAAQRLLARLEEVMLQRGEPPPGDQAPGELPPGPGDEAPPQPAAGATTIAPSQAPATEPRRGPDPAIRRRGLVRRILGR